MGRKPTPGARPYTLTPQAIKQRSQAAHDRWAALNGADRSLPGRPKKRKRARGANGRFIATVQVSQVLDGARADAGP